MRCLFLPHWSTPPWKLITSSIPYYGKKSDPGILTLIVRQFAVGLETTIIPLVLFLLPCYMKCNTSYRTSKNTNSPATQNLNMYSGERPPCLIIFDLCRVPSLSQFFRYFLFKRALETRNACISHCSLSDSFQNSSRKFMLICLAIHHNTHLLFS